MRVAECLGVTFQLLPWLEFVITINGEAAQCVVNVLFVVDLCVSVTSVTRITMFSQNGTPVFIAQNIWFSPVWT